jgi:hypothetical protein
VKGTLKTPHDVIRIIRAAERLTQGDRKAGALAGGLLQIGHHVFAGVPQALGGPKRGQEKTIMG